MMTIAIASSAFVVLVPRTATSDIARTMPGKASTASTMRWITMSTHPPANPLTSPTSAPPSEPRAIARKPTYREILDPCRMRLNMSRPRSSVPKKWVELGAWNVSIEIPIGSYGATYGADKAERASTAMTIAEAAPRGLRSTRTVESMAQ